jgi:hypothetical protein
MGKARQRRRERERATKPAPAVEPSRVELSLIAGGMRPELARETAKVWAKRHGRNDAGRDR